MLAGFGPLVTDTYLPALPVMKTFFNTSPSMVQLSLMTSLVGLALGQLIFGPLSDKFGRRVPLLISLGLFVISTFAAVVAWDINSFILFRFIQGLAGAGGVVASRSIATDLFSGKDLTKTFSIIGAIMGLAPIGAPVIGGFLLKFTNWQGIFITLLIIGIFLLLISLKFRESLPVHKRHKESALSTFKLFVPIFKNKLFMLYISIMSIAMGVMFAYIAASPFIFQNGYGLSPLQFSLCFAINATAFTLGSFAWSHLGIKKTENGVLIGAIGMAVFSIITSLLLINLASFIVIEIILFVLLFFAGLIFPTSSALALNSERQNAGTAASIMGALNFIIGGLVAPLVGLGNILTTTSIIIVICAFIVLILAFIVKKLQAQVLI